MIQPPPRIAAAARKRVQAADGQRLQVAEAVEAGRPLDAEPDAARKVRRIQAIAGVNTAQAEVLARNADPAALGLAGERRLGAERIQGKTRDFVGVSFLERALQAAATVGRVVFRDSLRPQGSGFLISDRLFLTNNHVISTVSDAEQFLVEFSYELDVDGQPKTSVAFTWHPMNSS